ncbi:MAG: hypothetical protein ACO1OT_02615 [Heyndrickxia sp.]
MRDELMRMLESCKDEIIEIVENPYFNLHPKFDMDGDALLVAAKAVQLSVVIFKWIKRNAKSLAIFNYGKVFLLCERGMFPRNSTFNIKEKYFMRYSFVL